MRARVEDRFLCGAFLVGAVEAVALRLRQDILAPLIFRCSSFYACHTILCKETAAIGLVHLQRRRAAAAHAPGTRFLGVEMVVPRRAGDDRAAARDAQAFAVRFVRFHTSRGIVPDSGIKSKRSL